MKNNLNENIRAYSGSLGLLESEDDTELEDIVDGLGYQHLNPHPAQPEYHWDNDLNETETQYHPIPPLQIKLYPDRVRIGRRDSTVPISSVESIVRAVPDILEYEEGSERTIEEIKTAFKSYCNKNVCKGRLAGVLRHVYGLSVKPVNNCQICGQKATVENCDGHYDPKKKRTKIETVFNVRLSLLGETLQM